MNSYADKKDENKSHASSHSLTTQKSGGKSAFQFVDNRPEAIVQRKLQEKTINRLVAQRMTDIDGAPDNPTIQKIYDQIVKPVSPAKLQYEKSTSTILITVRFRDSIELHIHYNLNSPENSVAHIYNSDKSIRIKCNDYAIIFALRYTSSEQRVQCIRENVPQAYSETKWMHI